MLSESRPTFSIIIPVFNEAENIRPLIESILEIVGNHPEFLEIILVDDGSTDATVPVINKFRRSDGRIRLARHHRNHGLGAAIRTGLEASKGDLVLYTDADLPFDFRLIPKLISQADQATVIAGSRLNRGEGLRRLVLTRGYNFLISLLFGLKLKDVNFACKILPRRFLRKVVLTSTGSFIDAEILLEARRLGLTIIPHPMVYYPRERGLSTLSRGTVIIFILSEMFGYKFRLFSEGAYSARPISLSPFARISLSFSANLISIVVFLERVLLFRHANWVALILGTAVASILCGWRAGAIAAGSTAIFIGTWLRWHNNPFFYRTASYVLISVSLGLIFSELTNRIGKLVDGSFSPKTSE